MGEDEARELLSATAVDFSEDDVAELVRHTEGWPAGLYLAALAVGTGAGDVGALTGNDPFVVDFLRSEFLARLPEDEVRFLTRTSILDDCPGRRATRSSSRGAPNMVPVALAERALIAMARNEWVRADALAEQAVWTVRHSRLQDHPLNALVYAIAGRTALHAERTTSARASCSRRRSVVFRGSPTPSRSRRFRPACSWPGATSHLPTQRVPAPCSERSRRCCGVVLGWARCPDRWQSCVPD
jgi:hypothetical protein